MLYYKEFQYLYDYIKNNKYLMPIAAGCYVNNQFIITSNDFHKHAEEILIEEYSPKTLYITLEPCPSCFFKCIQFNVQKIYFGSYNTEYGSCGGKFIMSKYINNNIEYTGGFYANIFSEMLKMYFQNKRL